MKYIIIDPGQIYVYGFGNRRDVYDLSKKTLDILDRYSNAASKHLKVGESNDATMLQVWDFLECKAQHAAAMRGKMAYLLADHGTKEYIYVNELGVEQEDVVDKKDHIKNIFERVHALEDGM